ncbi:homoserine dehydrogenase [Leptolyngbya cf. ectocarpi LEGE 11479]|uniref:Homoserine dehydrogenase n=1 Tax=Leptolyngbya cf. ectocarpi LEGE 11479 TaxID=1828722 RepID=A0A929FD53_LEPEC|nr:homoserine dehydrogenase [Leptolyngbya ectocarpi]MBE9070268.1 homoserine dehydrogenase [Leptolyngbya cf. ectocarpi LEGE 11479]
MVFKVGLLGLGTVGTGTAKILLDAAQRHPLLQTLEIHRVGVRSMDKPRAVDFPEDCLTTDLEAIVTDPDIDIVVEVIGGLEPARSLILEAIEDGKHVVTANKAVISRYGNEIAEAAKKAGVYVLYEAAVGGGIPVIQPLQQALGVNRIETVTGIINGTTNYILTRMQSEGGDFEPILADAQALGYAEADPTADVDGLDAADKIAILASIAFGGKIRREDVFTEGIRHVSAVDVDYAETLGFVIKLLAIAKRNPLTTDKPDTIQLRVHPTLVPLDHPLANVNDVNNAVLVEGDPIGQVMLYGPGAGEGPTASAIVSDMMAIAATLHMESPAEEKLPNPLLSNAYSDYKTVSAMEELESRFYLRLMVKDQPGVIGHLGDIFGKHNLSLESIVQIGLQENLAELVIVTHEVQEGAFQQAITVLKESGDVDSIASVLRVLG